MYYGEMKKCDIANGPGVRVTLFVSGCTNRCEGCFQPQTWNFCYGQPFTKETEDTLLEWLAPGYITGLTLLGGEPFEPDNQRALLPFVRRVKAAYPEKSIWAFSGEGGVSGKEHLGVFRLLPGERIALRGQPPAVRGDGRAALAH